MVAPSGLSFRPLPLLSQQAAGHGRGERAGYTYRPLDALLGPRRSSATTSGSDDACSDASCSLGASSEASSEEGDREQLLDEEQRDAPAYALQWLVASATCGGAAGGGSSSAAAGKGSPGLDLSPQGSCLATASAALAAWQQAQRLAAATPPLHVHATAAAPAPCALGHAGAAARTAAAAACTLGALRCVAHELQQQGALGVSAGSTDPLAPTTSPRGSAVSLQLRAAPGPAPDGAPLHGHRQHAMAGCHWVPQLARAPAPPAPPGPPQPRPPAAHPPAAGCYVITGGSGAVAAQVALWLAACGAARVVLASRSGALPTEVQQHAARQQQPAEHPQQPGPPSPCAARPPARPPTLFVACKADTGLAEDCAWLLAGLPPAACGGPAGAAGRVQLAGLMHAAGVLADATLPSLGVRHVRAALAAKAGCLRRMGHSLRLQPGAHHVLFSSVASLLGSPGQASYGAANAALDAAAEGWQHAGLPAVSVQWGAWAGGGMAAQHASTAARMKRMGLGLLEPHRALHTLGEVLAGMRAAPLRLLPPAAAAPPAAPAAAPAASPAAAAAAAAAAPPAPATVAVLEADWGVLATGLQQQQQQQQRQGGKATAAPAFYAQLLPTPRPQAAHASPSRAAAPAPSARHGPSPASTPAALEARVRQSVQDAVAAIVGSSVPADAPLMAAGLDSLGATELRNSLEASLQLQLPGTLVFDYPSVDALAAYLAGLAAEREQQQQGQAAGGPGGRRGAKQQQQQQQQLRPAPAPAAGGATAAAAVAEGPLVVSAAAHRSPACCAPWAGHSEAAAAQAPCGGAPSGDPVGVVPLGRWDVEGWGAGVGGPKGAQHSTDARFGAFLAGAALFDLQAFGLTEGEAALMDPQQRLLLELSAEALAAGAGGVPGGAAVGTYVGAASSDYGSVVKAHTHGGAYHATANALSVIAGRVSFVHNLAGPALSVDTACSAALVAMHLGVCAVRSSHVGAALVAGVHVQAAPTSTAYVAAAGMLSPQGRCMVLDAAADGYVRGESCMAYLVHAPPPAGAPHGGAPGGAVLLVEGSAVNQDGRSSALTAPNGPAQQAVIRAALAAAGTSAASVDMLSMHGTGTALGDPVELAAIAAVL